jgi:hypothetical protein
MAKNSTQIDQRQAGFSIDLASEVFGRLGQNDFKRWPHPGLQDMPSVRRPIRFTNYDMRVYLRRAVFQSNIADQRKDLHLLFDRYLLIVSFIAIEITEHHTAKRADGREMARAKLLRFCK